jgi:uncharacterized protein (TIGR03545 family)
MKEREPDRTKPAGTPGAFRKPLKDKTFEKRYVRFIEHPGDRDFFIGCFQRREDAYVLRGDLGKDELKKLKGLLKEIQKNRKGALKLAPLAFAAMVIAAIVVFFTIFANPLLERAMERGLEAVFEARCDVDRFRLSLLRFRIALGGISVANRDSPMTNLFQMGRTEIRLKPQAVLRGKIYIEEVRADSIRFGTARTVSGALPDRPARPKKEKPKSDAPPLVDLRNFDAMALLNREYDKLKTPKLYDEAIAAYNATLAKWQGQVKLARTRTGELRAAAQPLLSLNAGSIRDVETLAKTIDDINAMVTTTRAAANDAAQMVSGIEADIAAARNLEQSARGALSDDIKHVKSYVDPGSGAAFAALEPSIREVLSDAAEQYLDYGLKALEVIEKLKAIPAAKPKTEKPVKTPRAVFRGRDVIFPVRAYPRFYLGILASDFTLDNWNLAFDLRGLSSDPDISGAPVTLALGLTEAGGPARQAAFTGRADFRTAAAERFSAGIEGKGFPVRLEGELAKVGISGFSGTTAFSLNMSGRTDGGASGGGEVRVSQARLLGPVGTLAEAVDAAVRESPSIDMGIQYAHWADRDDEFTISTNIADLVARAFRRIAEAYLQQALDAIERALRERISGYIDGRFVSREELDVVFQAARGDRAAVDQLQNTLNAKKTEFENRLKAAAGQAVQQVKDEAREQSRQVIQDTLQGNTPSLQAPSLPGLPGGGGLRLPGR